ncbi:hypothetical protein COX69_03105 [Candidatus Falkowbacteria bacterium CG_4_10_14_0_2_um_filter_48_10]|nr:MAG: hypothetical protein COX69_03105 [Candidatus Falkowbacteria bacterium CG_4_10_14_0_2_um_filter_48_10]
MNKTANRRLLKKAVFFVCFPCLINPSRLPRSRSPLLKIQQYFSYSHSVSPLATRTRPPAESSAELSAFFDWQTLKIKAAGKILNAQGKKKKMIGSFFHNIA